MSNGREPMTGKCMYCSGVFAKNAISQHLESCNKRKLALHRLSKRGGGKRKLFHITVEGAYQPEYWMHIEVGAGATLEDLDAFLRDIWLECCGHMSAFTIGETRYETGSGVDSMRTDIGLKPSTDRDMNYLLNKVVAPKLTFYHEYDFGTPTELVLEVLSEYEGYLGREPVRILARNEPPTILCDDCGKTAVLVCPECLCDSGKGWLCNSCARKHKCGDELLLPVVNSPRVGTCGYTG